MTMKNLTNEEKQWCVQEIWRLHDCVDRFAKQMKAKRIIITHIEEVYQLGHTELQKALKKTYPAYPLEVGFDGMRIKLE